MTRVNSIEIIAGQELPEDLDKYNNVILKGLIVMEPYHIIKEIQNVVENTRLGCHIWLEEISHAIIEDFYKQEKPFGRDGLIISEISGFGYQLTSHNFAAAKAWRVFDKSEWIARRQEHVICAIAKNEAKYIEDWVAWHLRIGYDRIYIYDNNEETQENYATILKDWINAGHVEVINARGLHGIQNQKYMEAYHSLPFKYMTIIDLDEFIWFKENGKYNNIKEFIENMESSEEDWFGIMLRWHCMAGGNEEEDKPIWETNTVPVSKTMRKDCRPEFVNGWTKSIYKFGYALEFNEHFAWEPESKHAPHQILMVNDQGHRTYRPWINHDIENQEKDEVFVKHFIFRSIQNVFYNKYLRGHAGCGPNNEVGHDGWKWWGWFHNMNYYTDVTPVLTADEQLFMRSKGMKINYTFRPNVILIYNRLDGNTNVNARINNFIIELYNTANTMNIVAHTNPTNGVTQPDYRKELGLPENEYSFDFSNVNMYGGKMCGHYFSPEAWLVEDGYQEPIIISIGFPLEYAYKEIPLEEQGHYCDLLYGFLCQANMRQMMRSILENPNQIIVPTFALKPVGDADGWKESLEPWLKTIGLSMPGHKLTNNTFVTSLSQYRKLKKYQELFIKKFGNSNDDFIVDNIKGGYTTPYHAYIGSMLAPFDGIFYMKVYNDN